MRDMKDSGVEWMGFIPEKWSARKLVSTLQSIGSGTTPKEDELYDGEINWLNTGDLTDSYILEIGKTIKETAINKYSVLKIYPPNSIVVAMYGATIGKLGITTLPTTTNQACCVMSPGDELEGKFLFYTLFGMRDHIITLALGAGQPNISQHTIKNLRIPLPYLLEQAHIASFLDNKCDQIDRIIEQQHAVIEKLKEYKQSVITEAVTKGLNPDASMKDSDIEWIGMIPEHWQVKKIKTLFHIVDDRNQNDDAILLSLFTAIGVKPRSEMEDKGNKSVTVINYKKVKHGDLIVNKLLAWMGAIAYSDYEGVTSPDYDVYRAHPNANVVQNYYHHYFRDTKFKDDCFKYGHGIMMMRWRTYPDEFKSIPVLNPPFEEQQNIARYVTKVSANIDKSIDDRQSLIEKIRDFKKSLIYEAVTGKLEV